MLASRVACADTLFKRFAGLLLHAPLKPDEGLWLYPCQAIHTVGMRFSIDVAFLDRRGKVVKILPDLHPGTLSPWVISAYHCLELCSGQLAKSGTQVGDIITWAIKNDAE